MSDWMDFLKQKAVQQFILENEQKDVQKLLLNPPQFKPQIRLIADQLIARKKAKGKLNEWLKPGIIMPPPLSIEQASSSQTADYKKRIFKGRHLLDLTGGMGVDCLALSNNFTMATYLEKEQRLSEIFTYNLQVFQKDIEVVNSEASSYLEKIARDQKVSVFLDPARRDELKNKVFQLTDCSPNLTELLPLLKAKADQVLIKLSPILDIQSIIKEVASIKEVHVVSLKNECKEILLLLDFQYQEDPVIKTINLDEEEQYFEFQISDESHADLQEGELKKYLYEPNASILKAGAFKLIGNTFGLQKISRHTHFYTSENLIETWAGKTFSVVESNADKKTIKNYAPNGYLNTITRNFPLKATELKKRYKIKDGGGFFLIGFRDTQNKPNLIIAKRV